MNAPFHQNLELTPEEALRQLELMMSGLARLEEGSNEELTSNKPQPDQGSMIERLTEDIRDLVLSVLKLDQADFSPTMPLMDYGLDSIAATEIGNLFTSRFNIAIPPTVFFEFQDLQSFVNYLMENYQTELKAIYPEVAIEAASPMAAPVAAASVEAETTTAEPSIVEPPKAEPQQQANAAVIVPIGRTTKPVEAPQVPLIDGPVSIENLWEMSEAEPAVVNGAPSARMQSVRPAAVPRAEIKRIDPHSEVRQPSREFLDAMKSYADQALVHTISRANKRKLEYATYGEGPPLLMLGGLLMHYSVMWLTNMKALGEHHKLIMFHMPGCGGLDLYEGLNLKTIAEDIADVLDAQGITQPLPVFGCSFGGVMAQAFATAYPERCSALAMAVSTPFAEGASNFQLLMKELQVSSRFMELNRGWPMARLPAYEKVIEGFDFRPQLRKLDIPSLIVAGGKDRYTTPEFSRMMAENLKGSRLVEFPDAGHLLTFSHHEEFNPMLVEFLASVPPREAVIPARKKASVFLPATQDTLDVTRSYVENGQQGHCVMLSEHSAQLALTLNALCNQNKAEETTYRSYFVPSLDEAVDAAFRLVRHHERNRNPKSAGRILVVDASQHWINYFNPLRRSQAEALVPDVQVVADLQQAKQLLQQHEFVAAALVAGHGTPVTAGEEFIGALKNSKALSILVEMNDHDCEPEQWLSRRISQHPDLIVFGEAISGFQAPVGAMLVNQTVNNPWLMTPSEGYVRQPMASFGLTVKLAFEYLSLQAADVLTPRQHQTLRQIAVDQALTYDIHSTYGNVGYAKVANMHGYDARFSEGYGLRSQISRKGERTREIIDCLANVGSAPRGLNPQDIVDNVLAVHRPQHDYWQDLAKLLQEKTGLLHTLPASSQTTAIEAALTLAHLAAPERRKALCFSGAAGFSMLSANSAMDTVFDLFRKPFQPLYPHTVFIDPASPNAAQELEKELLSGELAFVWVETIQVEGNAVRPLPQHLIDLVNRHHAAGGYLVAVDETQTNLGTGKFLHSEGLVDSPDIITLAMGLTDSLFPVGAVLAAEHVIQAARKTNTSRVRELMERSANQLSAHIALNALQQIEAGGLMLQAEETGAYLKDELLKLAGEFPLIRDVRGEGLILGVEFNLDGYDAFVQQSFGYFLWGAMLRDEEFGVAVVVCPIHNRNIRVMPPLTITREEADIIVANLRRRMQEGVEQILENCAAYALERGDHRLAEFLSSIARKSHE